MQVRQHGGNKDANKLEAIVILRLVADYEESDDSSNNAYYNDDDKSVDFLESLEDLSNGPSVVGASIVDKIKDNNKNDNDVIEDNSNNGYSDNSEDYGEEDSDSDSVSATSATKNKSNADGYFTKDPWVSMIATTSNNINHCINWPNLQDDYNLDDDGIYANDEPVVEFVNINFVGQGVSNKISDKETKQAPVVSRHPLHLDLFSCYHGKHDYLISNSLLLNYSLLRLSMRIK